MTRREQNGSWDARSPWMASDLQKRAMTETEWDSRVAYTWVFSRLLSKNQKENPMSETSEIARHVPQVVVDCPAYVKRAILRALEENSRDRINRDRAALAAAILEGIET